MNDHTRFDAFGTLTEPATLTIQRLLPGPIERVWAYLTDGELRRQWLAAGAMKLEVGAPFELVWRNDELTLPAGQRPDGFGPEQRMPSRITELDPPRKLGFTWRDSGDVTITLEPKGDQVLLTMVHRRLPERGALLMVGAGWHTHLDILVVRLSGREPPPYWDKWTRLKAEYDRRLPT
ncbi:MAG: SRPBCC family protein [Alphaproteobacteria bacterium]|nr:SRPBCC family protein [Alphaproteobacteria bacterium]